MNFLYPLLAIASETAGKTIDKLNLTHTRISARQLMFLVFVGMFALLSVFIVITRQPFPAFTLVSFGLVVLIGVVSFVANIFDFLSLKANDLSLREPLVGFKPILAGLIGFALFPDERKPIYLVAFALGAIIVYWGSRQRRLGHIQKKGMFYLIVAVVLYALLPSIFNVTLPYISPAYIAFFRVVAVLAFTCVLCPVREIRKITSKGARYGLVSGVVYAVGAVAGLYMLQTFGVVASTLFAMLEPTLKYLSSFFVLKENVRRGEVASSVLIAVIIVTTLFIS